MLPSAYLEAKPTPESHFAWLRTWLAAERTFMAWLRTAAAMIGFGFTIVEFFERFSEMKGVTPARMARAPHDLGLMLIGVGVLALAIAMWQYHRITNELEDEAFKVIAQPRPRASPSMLLGISLLAIGLFAFAAIAIRG
jgi:putative membrane protein